MATTLSLESIKELFPHPVISRQIGAPTYETINDVHTKLKANASSVPTTLGGGAHGLLGLMLGPATYLAITGHNFATPPNPGAQPVIAPGTTRPRIEGIVRAHASDLRTYQEASRTDQALKQILLDSFDDKYLRGLRNRHTAYAGSTALQLIQYLYTNYGVITQLDLNENETKMKSPYDPAQPIEVLYDQIESAVEYADSAGAPFTDTQIVTTAYLLIFRTGLYKDACKEWNRRALAEKTWHNFKTDFTAAHRELIHFQQANQQAGFHQPGQANNAEIVNAYHEETTEAIHALAQATNSDRQAVANLTQANATLSTQVTELRTLFSTLDSKLNRILSNSSRNNNAPARDEPNHAARRRANTSYCWTHGRTRTDNHTSENCRNPAEGHVRNATLSNRQGGSDRNCN